MKQVAAECKANKDRRRHKNYEEKELLPTSYERSSRKVRYEDDERAALDSLGVPFMITLAAPRRLSAAQWLELVREAIRTHCRAGLKLKIDAFKQMRDRSVHLAIWGLPRHREPEMERALDTLRRPMGGRKTKKKKKNNDDNKKPKRPSPLFAVVGGSLSYLWAHEEIATVDVVTVAPTSAESVTCS